MAGAKIVTLYTHKGCWGGEAAQQYLDAHGVAYRLRDILLEPEGLAEFHRLGGVGTPLLQIDQHVMHGFDPEEFERLVALLGERGATRG